MLNISKVPRTLESIPRRPNNSDRNVQYLEPVWYMKAQAFGALGGNLGSYRPSVTLTQPIRNYYVICRGLVACANAGNDDCSNGSQFFITTERADELTRKYTIFGRVSGETIFTVLRMQELEVDDKDRPSDPPIISSCEVLLPPMDDIVPRTTPAEKKEKAAEKERAKKLADIQKRKQHGTLACATCMYVELVSVLSGALFQVLSGGTNILLKVFVQSGSSQDTTSRRVCGD